MTVLLDEDEYRSTQVILLRAAAAIGVLELEAFLATLERADAMGAVLDPTLYRAAMTNLDDIRQLARAALKVKTISERLQGRLLRELEQRTAPAAVATKGRDE